MHPINTTQEAQRVAESNLQGSGEGMSPLLVKTAPEPGKDFWPQFLDDLRIRFNIVFDQWESDFRDGRTD
jgi:hypothetical protein